MVGPVGEVCSLNVGAVVQHDPADALVPWVTPAKTGRVLGVTKDNFKATIQKARSLKIMMLNF